MHIVAHVTSRPFSLIALGIDDLVPMFFWGVGDEDVFITDGEWRTGLGLMFSVRVIICVVGMRMFMRSWRRIKELRSQVVGKEESRE